ncbi:MAG: ABC transporter permease [Prolixibacteraceae bacterium]|nr:ABC transporter permease [Prolixibacteraceae bacterium]
MNAKRITTGLSMILKMLFRRRIIIISLVVIPVLFLTIVELTAPTRTIPFRLASLDIRTFIRESLKEIALVFFAVTSSGFLVSLLALNLIQVENDVNRRLVICGYHPFEILISNLLALSLLIVAIAVYIGLLVSWFVPINNLLMFIVGLALIGFVYGCYGLAIGSLIKGKMEGVFLIVMLANIDSGWLQNPMYYAEAHNNVIIRYLPAYFPSQSAVIAAFTDYSGAMVRFYGILYGSGFLILSMFIFYNKMRIKK